jgi:hypothetical protein
MSVHRKPRWLRRDGPLASSACGEMGQASSLGGCRRCAAPCPSTTWFAIGLTPPRSPCTHAYDAAGSCYQAGRKGIREFIAPTAGGKADRVDQLRALGSWSVISSGRGMCIRRLRLRRQLARSFPVVLRPWLSLQRQVASLSSKISALVEMARATACVGPLVSNAFLTLVPASSSGRLTFRRPAGTL